MKKFIPRHRQMSLLHCTSNVCPICRQVFHKHGGNAAPTADKHCHLSCKFLNGHISTPMTYFPVLNPANTTFLALPCFLGIVGLENGDATTSAILSGGW